MIRKLIAASLGMAFAGTAAAVYIPPPGPLYVKFNNAEQVSATNSIVAPSGATEGNWGVFVVSTINAGNINPPQDPQLFPQTGFPLFTDGPTGQITGIFYGVQTIPPGASCPFASCLDAAGGFIDLYWDDPSAGGTIADISLATPGDRTADDQFTNFTDGTFLVRLAFASGIDPLDPNVHIRGDVVPSGAGFNGNADSFANVVDFNGDGVIDSADGAWASLLNGDYFTTAFGPRDIRLANRYNERTNWDGGGDIFGANSDDPIRAFAVPEPGTLALLGISLLGIAGLRRKLYV